MQPSQLEIQREVEALRDIKRRSTLQGGPGALILDPDLPAPSSPTSPTTSYWPTTTPQQTNDGDSSSGSHEDSSSSEERANSSDDPFHLFWVPASLHPEIAPAEFRAFLREHSHTPPPDGSNVLGRSGSLNVSSPGLERRRSMLSRQYKPSESDDTEEEQIVPLRRNRTILMNTGPQLTISDLQRLEELAEEASRDGDPSKFRTVLRRSLSLNVSPSAIDKMDNIPPMPDEADAPIILPPPGQILRRAARTKIRKLNLPGDGEGHRFGLGRRRRAATNVAEPRTSSELSSNDHASTEHGDSPEQIRRPRAFSTESITSNEHSPRRPDSYSEETSIYDAYVIDESESELSRSILSLITPQAPVLSLSLPPDESTSPPISAPDVAVEPPSTSPPLVPELQHPQPQRINFAATSEESSRAPSPDATTLVPSAEETDTAPTLSDIPTTTSRTLSPVPKKEKDKKGLFSKWGSSDKSGKKNAKAERDREKEFQRAEKEKEKEKESGFFGSLFSGKKKQDEQFYQAGGYAGSGRETAAALLGASKSSKGFATSPSPQPGPQGAYARYPIHVERAIYRLSHIKLANPRRPLYEQVLISNLMFWYLGVINKTQNPTPAAAPPEPQPAATGPVSQASEQEDAEGDKREAEERQRAENERLERERQEREIREREREKERERDLQSQQQKEKSRRGTLTKVTPGQPGGRRAAEMPVKGPQYEMQHRVMEHEYNGPGFGYGSPPPGGTSAPRAHRQPSPPVHQPQPTSQPESTRYTYTGAYGPGGMDPHLPPGAMAPSPAPLPASPAPVSRTRSSPSPPPTPQNGTAQLDGVEFPSQPLPARRSRSPPSQNHNRYSPSASVPSRAQPPRGSTRSLSATASPIAVPLSADGKARKAVSAHAVVPLPNGKPRAGGGSVPVARGEEEDVPLAVWKQQRRR
ncbi:hypothetical protein PAXRUDRAFT_822826 [Paxillus rubicundulus Ve08.2h10]|uniref:Protein Zds1 C-terminal domain-containing protein n=1 Tax=Paxillus rubicundulus Ve08.2h10 TaxID=930991 RepID=A0A0D0DW27_9AGAM|nr:hypothetical protein PAXRUDRAFT_822826 [Paxillus rubicundulus Ve08.2h10]